MTKFDASSNGLLMLKHASKRLLPTFLLAFIYLITYAQNKADIIGGWANNFDSTNREQKIVGGSLMLPDICLCISKRAMFLRVYTGPGNDLALSKGKYCLRKDTLTYFIKEVMVISMNTGHIMHHEKKSKAQYKFHISITDGILKLRYIEQVAETQYLRSVPFCGSCDHTLLFVPTTLTESSFDFDKWTKFNKKRAGRR